MTFHVARRRLSRGGRSGRNPFDDPLMALAGAIPGGAHGGLPMQAIRRGLSRGSLYAFLGMNAHLLAQAQSLS